MPYQVITLPFDKQTSCFQVEQLNRFCMNKQINYQHVEFFTDGDLAYWTVFLEYEVFVTSSGKEEAHLTDAGKICYKQLKAWRKEKAEQEGIPPYVIASNSHLVEIVKKEMTTMEALKEIQGFGKKKLEKYGKEITEMVQAFFHESS